MKDETIKLTQNTGITLVISFFLLFLVNSIVMYLASTLFPDYIVLGTATINKTWAIIHSMSTLALINTFIIPFVREYELRKKRMIKDTEWILLYFVINALGLWIIARFSQELGFGIKVWYVAVVLAVVIDAAQAVFMMTFEKLRTQIKK